MNIGIFAVNKQAADMVRTAYQKRRLLCPYTKKQGGMRTEHIKNTAFIMPHDLNLQKK